MAKQKKAPSSKLIDSNPERQALCVELGEWGEDAVVGSPKLRMPAYVSVIAKDAGESAREIARLYAEFDHLNSVGHGGGSRTESIATELGAVATALCNHVKTATPTQVKRYWRARWVFR